MLRRLSLILLIPVIYASQLGAAGSPDAAARLDLDDEALAVAALAGGEDGFAILSRRGVVLFARSGDGWSRAASFDLATLVPAGARLPRRAEGYLDPIDLPGDQGRGAALLVRSTALGLAEPILLAREGNGFARLPLPADLAGGTVAATAAEPPTLSAAEPTGRSLRFQPRKGEAVRFHLDGASRLVATPADGVPLDPIGPVGDILSVVEADGGKEAEARVFASAPAMPGEPGRVLELRWSARRFAPARRSVEIPGRVVAFARLTARREAVVVAAIDRPGHSEVRVLPEAAFWEEAAPPALAGPAAARPRDGGTLRIHLGADPIQPVPSGFLNPADRLLVSAVFGTLVREDPDGRIRPGLARGWEEPAPSAVEATWLFRLDPLARFSGGAPVRPQDVIAAWEDLLRSRATPYRFLLDPVQGAEAFARGEAQHVAGLAASGADLSIALARPAPDLLRRLAHPALGVGRIARGGAPLGAGPFTADPAEAGAAANPYHPDGRPFLDAFRTVPAGTVDPALLIDAREADAAILYGRSAGRLVDAPPPTLRLARWAAADRTYFVCLNPDSGFFSQSPILRNLLAKSFDRDAILRYLFDGRGEATTSFFPGGEPAPPPATGVRLGGGKSALVLTFDRDDPLAASLAARVKATWEELNLPVQLEGLDARTLRDRLLRDEYDALLGAWQPPTADPLLGLWGTVASLGPAFRGTVRSLGEASAAPDLPARLEAARRIEALLVSDSILLPLVRLDAWLATTPRLAGVVPSAGGLLGLEEAWLQP